MFKTARWRNDKNRIKVVFKLQFRATQVPHSGSELMVCLAPVESGRSTVKSEKATVTDGTCLWKNPVYETVKLTCDAKTGKINERVYQFIISSTGLSKTGILGGVALNLADYVKVFQATIVSLPLKPFNTGAMIHVTVQRIPDGEGRETGEYRDATDTKQRKTLQSQFSNIDYEDDDTPLSDIDHSNFVEVGNLKSYQGQMRFSSNRNSPLIDSNFLKSHSFGAISPTASDSSSNICSARENSIRKNTPIRPSPLGHCSIPQKQMASSGEWSSTSALNESTDSSTNSSEEPGLRENSQDSGDSVDKLRIDVSFLTRKLEMSNLELQTLRKQVAKDSKRSQDYLDEIDRLKEERDTLKRQRDELRLKEQSTKCSEAAQSELQLREDDPVAILKEIKQELNHEKNTNLTLRLQLQKSQEANFELRRAVKDLDALLNRGNGEKLNAQAETRRDSLDMELEGQVQQYEKTTSKDLVLDDSLLNRNEEHFASNVPANKHDRVLVVYSTKKKDENFKNEIDLYNKDRDELEMQMEQLALDYEILKQQNHDISTKLQQTQIREQLGMQYECCAHLSTINDLEAHIESLEKKVENQAESFEADIENVLNAKVEQEKRAIRAEEELWKVRQKNAKTVEQLQEEVTRLSAVMLDTFLWNEKLVTQSFNKSNELHSQKNHLQKLLDKKNSDLEIRHGQYHKQFQQLLGFLNLKVKETDRLALELEVKKQELDSFKKLGESRLAAALQDTELFKTEVEKLEIEKLCLSVYIEQNGALFKEIEELTRLNREGKTQLQDKTMAIDILNKEVESLRTQIDKLLDDINELRSKQDEKDVLIKRIKSEVAILRLHRSKSKQCLPEGLKLVLSLMEETKKDDISNQTKEAGEDIIRLSSNNPLHEGTDSKQH